MSAFQDFGPLSERRRLELQQRRRKRIMMAGGSISVILIIAVVATVAVVFVNKNANTVKDNKTHSHSSSSPSGKPVQSSTVKTGTHMVETVCSHTDYKDACVSSLAHATNSSSSNPKHIIKSTVSVISDHADDAFGQANLYKTDDPLSQGAIDVCLQLLNDTKSDLNATVNKIDISGLQDLPKIGPELSVWLSAVRSYQETCVDSFSDDGARNKMKDAMKNVNQLTSNALAIISNFTNILSALNIPGLNRRLLSVEKEEKSIDDEGFPSWVEEGDRRVLKEGFTDNLKPDVVVAQDGSGQFKTIYEALRAIPEKYDGRYVIYVKAGLYNEQVTITKKMVNITMYGDGSTKTIITGSANANAGVQTYLTATFAVMGDGFMAVGVGFSNTAGPAGHQAVALRVQADCAIFLNCRMLGFQDTLYAQCKRQFYRGCIITGTVDYIFGDASAIFQNCVFAVRRPSDGQQNIVTAHGRADKRETSGFVIHKSRIIAAEDFVPVQSNFKSYLARPWKPYSRTVIMESEIDGLIDPAGYLPWGDTTVGQDTCFYAEYNNKGDGASTAQRADWPGVKKELTKQMATQFTASAFVADIGKWSTRVGVSVPLRLGFFN